VQFWSPIGCKLGLHNFLGGAAWPAGGPSQSDELVRGVHQVVIHMLPLCKKNTKACELEKARKVVVKVGRVAPKQS